MRLNEGRVETLFRHNSNDGLSVGEACVLVCFCLDQVVQPFLFIDPRQRLACLYKLQEGNNAAISVYVGTAQLWVFIKESDVKHVW